MQCGALRPRIFQMKRFHLIANKLLVDNEMIFFLFCWHSVCYDYDKFE